METSPYLKVARASDLENSRDRLLYRILEIFPGFLSYGTLVLAVFFSFLFPLGVAVFIIAFVLYWLFRNIYLAFHLRAGYLRMREYEKIDWLKKLEDLSKSQYTLPISHWRDLYHLIVLPVFLEPREIIHESISSLSRCDYPKDRMIVVLAIEKRGGIKMKETAALLRREFQHTFFRFFVTEHPSNLPGEIAGKGSNETWALRQVKKKFIDPLHIPYENIIVSSFDADTVVFPKYFSCLSYHYLTLRDPTHSSFQPVPLFLNNIWKAGMISRLFAFSTTFWALMNQERPEKLITFSSHSMSFRTLVEIDFKQTNVVSDDSRIFWQCFLKYNGNYRVQPLFYPVSMDANAAPTFVSTLKNIYKQHRRWAYGVADIPYFLFGFLKNKEIPFQKKFLLGFELIEAHWSWATASLLIFFLGWLPLFLGGEDFSQTLLSYNLPRLTSRILTVSMIGLLLSLYLSMLLLPPRPQGFGKAQLFSFIIQWFFLPVSLIFFSLPALEAQARLMAGKYLGFWPTPKFRF